jgi:hypothetical protein
MGGLLPSWNEYNRGKINKPSDAAKHWEEVSTHYQIPLDGDVWFDDLYLLHFLRLLHLKQLRCKTRKKL